MRSAYKGGIESYLEISISLFMARNRYERPWFTIGLYLTVLAGLIVMSLGPSLQLYPLMVGSWAVCLGLVIRKMAISTLGANFSGNLKIRSGHTLVTAGIYRWVRHPAYLGELLLFAGLPIMVSSLPGLLVMLLLVPWLLIRIHQEERMLVARFGNDYLAYARSSKRLVPFIF